MNLQATEEIEVFIDAKWYNTPLEKTQVGFIPQKRRIRIGWKGCYYTIKKGEKFKFDRGNDWDVCYFKLENGAEFKQGYGRVETFIKNENVKVL
jgi:hypothetical protein|tara:strand:+ start:559 stop:840 length:282 start_codon:yes stop_codon:yes gene_type:complete